MVGEIYIDLDGAGVVKTNGGGAEGYICIDPGNTSWEEIVDALRELAGHIEEEVLDKVLSERIRYVDYDEGKFSAG